MTALRPSYRPPPAPLRAKSLRQQDLPLRAGDGPRHTRPIRGNARRHGATVTDVWARKLAVTDAEIAQAFENFADRFGAEVRSGTAVVTAGEVARLFPSRLAFAVLIELVCDRIAIELARSHVDPIVAGRYGLALAHLSGARVLLVAA